MALIRSQIATTIVGSIGGATFYYTRYGAIVVRSRTKPVDTNTNFLEIQRALFSQSVNGWKTLTQLQRDAWEAYASSTPWKNALGDTVYLTGQAMYIKFRSSFLSAQPGGDYADFDDAPCDPGLFPMPSVGLACCPDPDVGVIVTVSNLHLTDNMDFLVRRSYPQSLSRAYHKGPYATAQNLVTGNVAPDSSAPLEFCDICEGMYFFEVMGWQTNAPHVPCSPSYYHQAACTLPV